VLGMLFDAGAKVIKNDVDAGDGVNAFRAGPGCTFTPAWQTATGRGTQPSPAVLGDVVVALGGDTGGVVALDARSGQTLWSAPTGAPVVAPPIGLGNLVVTADYTGVVRVFAPPSLGGRSEAPR
jgi:outer membrane protein assembly factor BamB